MEDTEAGREIRQKAESNSLMLRAVNAMPSREHRYQQRQRRIYERTGVHIPLFRVRSWGDPDYLQTRAMWRRQGRALVIRSTVVGGVRERFLAP